MKETFESAEYYLQKLPHWNIMEMIFKTALTLWVLEIPLSRPGKISPSNVYQD